MFHRKFVVLLDYRAAYNQERNRYGDVLCLDQTRVHLKPRRNEVSVLQILPVTSVLKYPLRWLSLTCQEMCQAWPNYQSNQSTKADNHQAALVLLTVMIRTELTRLTSDGRFAGDPSSFVTKLYCFHRDLITSMRVSWMATNRRMHTLVLKVWRWHNDNNTIKCNASILCCSAHRPRTVACSSPSLAFSLCFVLQNMSLVVYLVTMKAILRKLTLMEICKKGVRLQILPGCRRVMGKILRLQWWRS